MNQDSEAVTGRTDIEARYRVELLKVRSSSIRNYTYIIMDRATSEAAIIDPAWEVGVVVAALDRLQARPTNIMLTHSHYDHVNIVEPLVRLFDTEVYMSEKEIDKYKFRCSNLNALHPYDSVEVGSTRLQCIFTPGHTAGSLCYLLPDSLFTGDTVFIEGCGVCVGEGSSPAQMFDSIQNIKAIVHPDVRIFPGHSFGKQPGYSLRRLLKENIYFLIQEKQTFIDFRMRTSFTDFLSFY